ncbi:uncharacterized protein LOC123711097 [Pieris brassicae]|uniref:uncharacterized protein LOC123711097 n=1 Tax=Pieris brassicae TaxID=7116 RepID=UPI001E6620A4|nr:uncharacterized protein LOC123711097 [Pieris brassicae]
MPKISPVFLIATAAVILLCFGVLCYLMKAVNPKPNPENARRYSSQIIPFTEELRQNGNLDYGLEKLPENVTVHVKPPTERNIQSFSSDNAVIFVPIGPNMNNSHVKNNITSENETNIKGQRRSIKYDDEYLDLIKIPSSLILNLRDYAGPKIIINLSPESINKRGRKRSSSKEKGYNKTVIVLEVNESILLNVIGNTEDTFDEKEPNMIKNELSFDNMTFNHLTENLINDLINSTTIPEYIIVNSDASSFNTTMFADDQSETSDVIEKVTFSSTEKITFNDTTDHASTLELDKTTTAINDLVVDLLMQGETLKDTPPRNNIMNDNVYITSYN